MVFKKKFSSLHKFIYVNFITRDKLKILSQDSNLTIFHEKGNKFSKPSSRNLDKSIGGIVNKFAVESLLILLFIFSQSGPGQLPQKNCDF